MNLGLVGPSDGLQASRLRWDSCFSANDILLSTLLYILPSPCADGEAEEGEKTHEKPTGCSNRATQTHPSFSKMAEPSLEPKVKTK